MTADIALTKILMRAVRIQGVFVGSRADLVDLCAFLTAHPDLRPVVDHVAPFDALPDALHALSKGQHVGKIAVPDSILNKPGRLTPEEFDEMKKHPLHGARIIANLAKLLSVNGGRGLISVCTAGGMGVAAIMESAKTA